MSPAIDAANNFVFNALHVYEASNFVRNIRMFFLQNSPGDRDPMPMTKRTQNGRPQDSYLLTCAVPEDQEQKNLTGGHALESCGVAACKRPNGAQARTRLSPRRYRPDLSKIPLWPLSLRVVDVIEAFCARPVARIVDASSAAG
jgi:hypothetical protein